MNERERHEWIRKRFFSDPNRILYLKKGDVLLDGNTYNKRLYHINSGIIGGFLIDNETNEEEVFRSVENVFVGVFSFFSEAHLSYAKLVALEDSEVSYVDSREEIIENGGYQVYSEYFVPIIVTELLNRQIFARNMANEKQNALKKLMQTANLTTLGQMAAGLAHELNNAIGVLQNKTAWFSEVMGEYLQEKDQHGMYPFFQKGFEKGQYLSSSEVRMERRKMEKELGIEQTLAHKLARTGLSSSDLKSYKKDINKIGERINYYWEIGTALHDMNVSSKHAAHVVRSVKQLGLSKYTMDEDVDVNKTIHEASAIMASLLRSVQLEFNLGNLSTIRASNGGLVQVWVNIIKNACESMITSNPETALLSISSGIENNMICVEIVDNGPGIPPQLLPTIFRPNVTTKVDGLSFGLGLGLSIVQKIVDSHEGEIKVSSEPGKTAFKILLPIRK
ncbi:MAG: ATP-binding protein [Cyclobacteriaceae bacterium]